jgi:hypothetical protein
MARPQHCSPHALHSASQHLRSTTAGSCSPEHCSPHASHITSSHLRALGFEPTPQITAGSCSPQHCSGLILLTVCVQADRPCQRPIWVKGHAVHLPAVPLLFHETRTRLNVPEAPGHIIAGSGLHRSAHSTHSTGQRTAHTAQVSAQHTQHRSAHSRQHRSAHSRQHTYADL